jgi:hypothetical protein
MENNIKFTYFKSPLNCYTFKVPKIKEWVENQCKNLVVLNLFAGPTRLDNCVEISNDIDTSFDTTYHMDALELVKYLREHKEVIHVALLDPPYSYRKSMEYYNGNRNSKFKQILDIIPELLCPNSKVICFGYHASQMGKLRGFKVDEILIVDHSGAMHSTLACVESRL